MTTEQDQTPKDNPSILDRAEKLAALCREFSKRIEKTQALLVEQEESAKANKANLDAEAEGVIRTADEILSTATRAVNQVLVYVCLACGGEHEGLTEVCIKCARDGWCWDSVQGVHLDEEEWTEEEVALGQPEGPQ
jgi:hypothetical protein